MNTFNYVTMDILTHTDDLHTQLNLIEKNYPFKKLITHFVMVRDGGTTRKNKEKEKKRGAKKSLIDFKPES